jgi:TPP-dependent indolepyruvate ferredoxin oxidoreductase alpha subunit
MGSLCGLGQTAPNPVLTTIRYFRDEYEAHVAGRSCPAKACTSLFRYSIDVEVCTGCGVCKRKCPVNSISGERKQPHVIDQVACTKCGTCHEVCPFASIVMI